VDETVKIESPVRLRNVPFHATPSAGRWFSISLPSWAQPAKANAAVSARPTAEERHKSPRRDAFGSDTDDHVLGETAARGRRAHDHRGQAPVGARRNDVGEVGPAGPIVGENAVRVGETLGHDRIVNDVTN